MAIAYVKRIERGDGPALPLAHNESPVCTPWSSELAVFYLIDDADRYVYVQQRQIDDIGLSAQDLHAISLRNLRDAVGRNKGRVVPYGNIFAFLMGGDFEASVILLEDLWNEDFRKLAGPDLAVAIPARDVLAFCPVSSEAGLEELNGVIERVFPDGDHLLIDHVLWRVGGRWSAPS